MTHVLDRHPLDSASVKASVKPSEAVPAQAVVILVAGMTAAWFAAGSTGLLGHPLQHALTWLCLAVAVVAAWPSQQRSFGSWAILAIGVGAGLLLTASTIPAVNILAVAVVLAAIAQISRGLNGRLATIAALGAIALGCFRFACDSTATLWLAADGAGSMLGRLAGWWAGCPLSVGATFGGIDFLVLMAVVYAGWIVCAVPPRRRALWTAVAIVFGHFVYLFTLAYSEKLLSLLPDVVLPLASDINNVGLWTWGNGLRTLIPWNLPLWAVVVYGTICAIMVRSTPWLPIVEIDPRELERQRKKEARQEIPGSALAADMLFRFGPSLLAVAAALFARWRSIRRACKASGSSPTTRAISIGSSRNTTPTRAATTACCPQWSKALAESSSNRKTSRRKTLTGPTFCC